MYPDPDSMSKTRYKWGVLSFIKGLVIDVNKTQAVSLLCSDNSLVPLIKQLIHILEEENDISVFIIEKDGFLVDTETNSILAEWSTSDRVLGILKKTSILWHHAYLQYLQNYDDEKETSLYVCDTKCEIKHEVTPQNPIYSSTLLQVALHNHPLHHRIRFAILLRKNSRVISCYQYEKEKEGVENEIQ